MERHFAFLKKGAIAGLMFVFAVAIGCGTGPSMDVLIADETLTGIQSWSLAYSTETTESEIAVQSIAPSQEFISAREAACSIYVAETWDHLQQFYNFHDYSNYSGDVSARIDCRLRLAPVLSSKVVDRPILNTSPVSGDKIPTHTDPDRFVHGKVEQRYQNLKVAAVTVVVTDFNGGTIGKAQIATKPGGKISTYQLADFINKLVTKRAD